VIYLLPDRIWSEKSHFPSKIVKFVQILKSHIPFRRIHQTTHFLYKMAVFFDENLVPCVMCLLPDRIWGEKHPFSYENSESLSKFGKLCGFLKKPYGIPQMWKAFQFVECHFLYSFFIPKNAEML